MASFLEIDLHLKAFHPNTAGLNAEEMVDLSIRHMRKELDKAMDKGIKEIRFIHGHGKGTLKERVYHELRVYERKGLISSFEPSFFNPAVVVVIIQF
ncbi:Smr domain-containing protein [bacterium A37T11]|nr:Smr domain-containing protein [bacterium A37T11]